MGVAGGTITVPTVVNHLPGGRLDYGCRGDEATKLKGAAAEQLRLRHRLRGAERGAISGSRHDLPPYSRPRCTVQPPMAPAGR